MSNIDSDSFWTILGINLLAILFAGVLYLIGAAIWSFDIVNNFLGGNWWWVVPVAIVNGLIDYLTYFDK